MEDVKKQNLTNDNITIKVSGTVFEASNTVWMRIYKSIPDVLKTEIKRLGDNRYFVERHSGAFRAILYHYQGEELHIPSDVCPSSFKKEIEFWGIEETSLAKCCYQKYVTFFDDQDVLKILETDEGRNIEEKEQLTTMSFWPGWRGFQARTWLILNEPLHSKGSKLYFGTSVVVIVVSLLALVVGTHPEFHRALTAEEWEEYFGADWHKYKDRILGTPQSEPEGDPETTTEPETTSEPETTAEPETEAEPETTAEPETNAEPGTTTEPEITAETETTAEPETSGEAEPVPMPENAFARYSYLDYIEYVCIGLFTLDIIVRAIFCPFKINLLKSILNWLDIFAVLVMYTKYTWEYLYPREKYEASVLDILHCLQVVRVFRLFRLVKNFVGFRVLVYAFRASFKEMMLMMLFLLIAVLLFSTFAFFSGDPSFPSIPDAMWWSIVTMTTVGYGDVVPKQALSKIIGAFCALSGVCLIAVIIPIFVNNFILFYSYSKVWGRKEEKKKLKQQRLKLTQVQAIGREKSNSAYAWHT